MQVFLILLLLSFCGLPIPALQSAEVAVPGTKVKLVPPAGLSATKQFPGFFDEESNASILVTEMPAPYSEMSKVFTKESLASKGITLISKEEISVGESPGLLLHVRQEVQVAVLKWMVITGNETEVVMITGTFPEDLKTRWSLPLRNSVLGAKWEANLKTDPLAGLVFTIQDDPELKFAKRISNMIALTKNGELPGKPNNDPLFIVGPAIGRAIIVNKKEFAERRLYQHPDVSISKIKNVAEVAIAGLQGYEFIAEGKQTKNVFGSIIIHQTILFDDDSYFLLVGFAPLDKEKQYLEIFQRVSKTFRKK